MMIPSGNSRNMKNQDVERSKALTADLHPLLQPLVRQQVLDCVFQFCGDIQDLRNFRLVCQTWHDAVLPFWRKQSPTLRVKGNRKFEMESNVHMMEWDSYVNILKADEISYEFSGRRKYQKLWFHSVTAKMEGAFMLPFKHQIGRCLTHLTLTRVVFHDLQSLKDVLFCKWTPKLKFLSIVINFEFEHSQLQNEPLKKRDNLNALSLKFVDKVNYHGKMLPVDWLDLLENHQKLQELKISHTKMFWNEELEKLLMALKTMRVIKHKILPLKTLSIGDIKHSYGMDDNHKALTLTPTLLKLLKDELRWLPLVKLSIYFGRMEATTEVKEILRVNSSTLKELSLEIYAENELDINVFTRIQALTSIKITGVTRLMELRFVKFLPNLKTLHLSYLVYTDRILGDTEEHAIADTISTSLTSFMYKSTFDILFPEDLQMLARLMPNLTELALALTNESFRVVCQSWPRLKRLITIAAIGTGLDDEGITGIPQAGTDNSRVYPNLTMLQDLTYLKLDFRRIKVTEKSLLQGVLHLGKLQTFIYQLKDAVPESLQALMRERINKVEIKHYDTDLYLVSEIDV